MADVLIKFTVPGEVRPKDRPRFTRTGRIFTPQRTLDYENKVKSCYISKYPYGVAFPEEAVEMSLDIYVQVPKSYSQKKKQKMIEREYPTKKPDTDDKQVVSVKVNKYWSEEPRAEVELRKRG